MGYSLLVDDCIKSFHFMINKFLELYKYTKGASVAVLKVLIADDETDKQLFYDFFKKVECNDKSRIVSICMGDMLMKTKFIVNNSDPNKINDIVRYIENYIEQQKLIFNNNRIEKNTEYIENFILSIHDFLYNMKSNINDELKNKINNLNPYEKLALDSILLNIMSINFNEIKTIANMNTIYLDDIIKLLDFYIPIFKITYYIKTNTRIVDNSDYVKIYSINHVLKLFLNNKNKIAAKILNEKEIIYYLIYHFLINVDLDKSSKEYINKVILMANNIIDLDENTIVYLIKYYSDYHDIRSLDEQIKDIETLKKSNLNPLLNLYASFDIAEYKKLEKRKEAFGIKK